MGKLLIWLCTGMHIPQDTYIHTYIRSLSATVGCQCSPSCSSPVEGVGCCEHTGVQRVRTALSVLPPPLTYPWSRWLQWTGLPLLWKKAAVLQTIGHPAGVWSMWLGARSVATQWLGLGTMSSVCIRTHVYGQNCPLRVWLAVQGCTGHTLHRSSHI